MTTRRPTSTRGARPAKKKGRGFAAGLVAGHLLSELRSIGRRLNRIEGQLEASKDRERIIMGKIDDLQAKLDEANEQTNQMAVDTANIAADIERIKADLAGGVSASEAAALQTKLDAHVETLKAQSESLKAVAAVVPE